MNDSQTNYNYCLVCGKTSLAVEAHSISSDFLTQTLDDLKVTSNKQKANDDFKSLCCDHTDSTEDICFQGVDIVRDFVTPEEEKDLVKAISEISYVSSQSGRRKQVRHVILM